MNAGINHGAIMAKEVNIGANRFVFFMSDGCTAKGTATRNDGYSKLPFSPLDPKVKPRFKREFERAIDGDNDAYMTMVKALEEALEARKDIYPIPPKASYRGLSEVVWKILIHGKMSDAESARIIGMSVRWYQEKN